VFRAPGPMSLAQQQTPPYGRAPDAVSFFTSPQLPAPPWSRWKTYAAPVSLPPGILAACPPEGGVAADCHAPAEVVGGLGDRGASRRGSPPPCSEALSRLPAEPAPPARPVGRAFSPAASPLPLLGEME
jgi:hypothetical protein